MLIRAQTERVVGSALTAGRDVTDWDTYYSQPCRLAAVTRPILARHLVDTIARLAVPSDPIRIGELGGGNSSFLTAVWQRFDPAEYFIIDNNRRGLELIEPRLPDRRRAHLVEADILRLDSAFAPALDCVFSVGLIEHFSAADTRRAVEAHFRLLRPGGLCVLTFPTPTIPYQAARRVSETMGWWIFHDERPLGRGEVADAVVPHASIEYEKTIWPIVFTQMLIAARRC